MRLFYCPLEPYPERYTLQLAHWTLTRLSPHMEVTAFFGQRLDSRAQIETGPVLDAYGRSHFALTQMAYLIAALERANPPLGPTDAIFLHDLFHPGYEALPYLLDQLPEGQRPRLYTQCWAQSVDEYDFTFPMRRWMRGYEQMADATLSGIFLASSVQTGLWRAAGLNTAPLHVTGLPFDKDEVRERGPRYLLRARERQPIVVWTARWDREKQPGFFLDLIEQMAARPCCRFEVLTGAIRLRSNEPGLAARAEAMAEAGMLTIHAGLAKEAYYERLAAARVQFNSALQDFVSFTLLEASALGTPSLYPAFRSFPYELPRRQLYIPWSLNDAEDKLRALLDEPPPADAIAQPAERHHQSLDRVWEILLGGADVSDQ